MLSYWSIQREDLKKLLPLCFIIFCLTGSGSLFRNLRDNLVVFKYAAETLVTLEIDWAIHAFLIIYIFLLCFVKREYILYAVMCPILLIFTFFALILPQLNIDNQLHLFLFKLIYFCSSQWMFLTLFICFWQFVISIVTPEEAKRYFVYIYISGMLGTNLLGMLSILFLSLDNASLEKGPLIFKSQLLIFWGNIMAIAALYGYRWIHKNALGVFKSYQIELTSKKINFKELLFSKTLWLIAGMIIIQACLILMMVLEFKRQLKFFVEGDIGLYNGLMAYYSFALGLFSLIFCIVIIQPMIKTLNWGRAAIVAPLSSIICGIVFFSSLWYQSFAECSLETTKFVTYCCMGSLIMMKSFIDSLFFITTELVFITLTHVQKTIGKTIIDTYCKSVVLIIPTLISTITLGEKELNFQTLIMEICIFLVMVVLWLLAVKALSKKIETQNNVLV